MTKLDPCDLHIVQDIIRGGGKNNVVNPAEVLRERCGLNVIAVTIPLQGHDEYDHKETEKFVNTVVFQKPVVDDNGDPLGGPDAKQRPFLLTKDNSDTLILKGLYGMVENNVSDLENIQISDVLEFVATKETHHLKDLTSLYRLVEAQDADDPETESDSESDDESDGHYAMVAKQDDDVVAIPANPDIQEKWATLIPETHRVLLAQEDDMDSEALKIQIRLTKMIELTDDNDESVALYQLLFDWYEKYKECEEAPLAFVNAVRKEDTNDTEKEDTNDTEKEEATKDQEEVNATDSENTAVTEIKQKRAKNASALSPTSKDTSRKKAGRPPRKTKTQSKPKSPITSSRRSGRQLSKPKPMYYGAISKANTRVAMAPPMVDTETESTIQPQPTDAPKKRGRPPKESPASMIIPEVQNSPPPSGRGGQRKGAGRPPKSRLPDPGGQVPENTPKKRGRPPKESPVVAQDLPAPKRKGGWPKGKPRGRKTSANAPKDPSELHGKRKETDMVQSPIQPKKARVSYVAPAILPVLSAISHHEKYLATTREYRWNEYNIDRSNQLITTKEYGRCHSASDGNIVVISSSGKQHTYDEISARHLEQIQSNHGDPIRIVCLIKSIPLVFCTTSKYANMLVSIPYDQRMLMECADNLLQSNGHDSMNPTLNIGQTFDIMPFASKSWNEVLQMVGQLMSWSIIAESRSQYVFKYSYLQYCVQSPDPYPILKTEYFEVDKEPKLTEAESCMDKYEYLKQLKNVWDESDESDMQDIEGYTVSINYLDEFRVWLFD